MNLIYLLQLTAIWLVCYLFYYGWLRNERFPKANRFFLLASLLAGPVIPFLPTIDWLASGAGEVLRQFTTQLEMITVIAAGELIVEETTNGSVLNWWLIIWMIGSVFALLRLVGGWYQLYKVFNSGERQLHPEGYNVIYLKQGGSPFSYGNTLFWPQEMDLNAGEWQAVKAHEEAHIQQRHTYDLILVDLLSVVFWWNPLPYLYRRSLRLQHEYLADEAATNFQQTNVRDYARLLLQHQLVGWVPRPGHAFHHSHIKNRIIMLTQPKGANWKLLAILPLFIALFWACNQDTADITGINMAETEEALARDRAETDGLGNFDLENGIKVYKTVDRMPIYGDCSAELATGDEEEAMNCGNVKLLTDIYENIKYPAVSRERSAEGIVVISFIVPAGGGKANNFKIVRSAAGKSSDQASKDKPNNDVTVTANQETEQPLQIASEKEAYDALDAAAMKVASELPQDWTSGMLDGKPVAVRFNLPIKFKLE